VNPISGKGRGKKAIPIIEFYCSENNVNYTIVETEYTKHATELAKANKNNFDVIVAVGGDGTVNEVINGIGNEVSLTFTVLPVGSGNDFVKNLGINGNIKDNLSIIHDPEEHEIIEVDIGNIQFTEVESDTIKHHKFINCLGIGFDAYVGHLNQKNKVLSGLSSYVYAVLRALFNFKMINVDLDFNETKYSGDKLMISIGNGISSGGGFYLTPNAIINDGLLDITIFETVTRARLLTALPMALLNKIEKVPEAKLLTSENLKLKLNTPYFVHCDGEIISEKLTTAEISTNQNVLKVIKKRNGD